MLASVWKIVSDSLKQLAKDGLTDQNVKQKLRDVPDLRERYLVLRHIVDVLVKMNQNKFSVLATTTRACIHCFNHVYHSILIYT